MASFRNILFCANILLLLTYGNVKTLIVILTIGILSRITKIPICSIYIRFVKKI
jgi:hypothetical protein